VTVILNWIALRMKSLKLFETCKLHYGKYLYKVVIHNSLNVIFRSEFQKDNMLGHAREKLDVLTEQFRKGAPLMQSVYRTYREVTIDDYLDAKDIYTCFKSIKDYKIRVAPSSSLTIYSNDRDILLTIISKIRNSNIEFWEPGNEAKTLLLNNSNIILISTPTDFPIKVTLGNQKVNSDFANWLKANTDKSKIGSVALDCISKNGWCSGYYFYLRDEKVLSLIMLLVGSNIRRVDKLVYNTNIDK
jgi:hypothetical protein